MIRPAVASRFFAFSLHDPRALGRMLEIFARGLVVLIAIVAVVGALVATGAWVTSAVGRVRARKSS
jgi:hypothetical protein